jgi:hypothetical protein
MAGRDDTVTLKLTRDEVSELKRLLIKEARHLEAAVNYSSHSDLDSTFLNAELGKELDELRHKIHDQI